MTMSAVALGAYNYLRWHSVLKFSYNGQGFDTPIGRGLNGPSPRRTCNFVPLIGSTRILVRTDAAEGCRRALV